jgi:hypothetical protein
MEMVLYLAKNITNLFSKGFICGAPARAFIKFIKGHAGFNIVNGVLLEEAGLIINWFS